MGQLITHCGKCPCMNSSEDGVSCSRGHMLSERPDTIFDDFREQIPKEWWWMSLGCTLHDIMTIDWD